VNRPNERAASPAGWRSLSAALHSDPLVLRPPARAPNERAVAAACKDVAVSRGAEQAERSATTRRARTLSRAGRHRPSARCALCTAPHERRERVERVGGPARRRVAPVPWLAAWPAVRCSRDVGTVMDREREEESAEAEGAEPRPRAGTVMGTARGGRTCPESSLPGTPAAARRRQRASDRIGTDPPRGIWILLTPSVPKYLHPLTFTGHI
jgi:hypothetical protein